MYTYMYIYIYIYVYITSTYREVLSPKLLLGIGGSKTILNVVVILFQRWNKAQTHDIVRKLPASKSKSAGLREHEHLPSLLNRGEKNHP